MKDYEEAVAFLGQWGRFQKIVFFLLCASTIPNGSAVLSIIFVAGIPSHHCKIPEVNLTEDWLNYIIPTKVKYVAHYFYGTNNSPRWLSPYKEVDGKQERSSCSRYKLDVVRSLSAQGLVPGRDVNVTHLEQESCLDGWTYSRDVYLSTIVTEYDLVCSEQWKQPITSTVYFLGVLTGSFFLGQLSDRYGRKPVFFSTMVLQTIFMFVQMFSNSWIVFCMLLFISGMGQIANYMSAFVLGSEILPDNVRIVYSAVGITVCFAIGIMILPLFAYFLRDWRSLVMAVSLPGLLYIPLWWFIPESPRWLVSMGRIEEAEAIVRKAAKRNKVQTPLTIFEDLNNLGQKPDKIRPEDDVFTLICGYIGLSLNSAQLSADPYVSTFISGAVEVPAYICVWLVLRYFPRRPSTICMILLGGVSLFFIQLVSQSQRELSIALEMLGKYGFTASATMLYPYTTEIYPTAIRSTATGTCATCSRIGACVAPLLLQLSLYFKYLPYILLGTFSVVCAFATFFLPETFGRPLPDTFQDA